MKKNKKITKVDLAFERIKNVLKVGTYKECLDFLGIKRGTFDTWKSRGDIPEPKLYEIALKLGVSKEWLETGEDNRSISYQHGKNMVGSIGSVGGHVIAGDGDGHGVVQEAPVPYGADEVVLPYYPEIYASAGGGAFSGFDASSPVSISRGFLQSYFGIGAAKGMHIINVVGDSMAPTLKNGEMIFVNPIENEGFRDGGVYVLMCGDTILVKRVRQHPITKEYTLISDNPEVEDITLTIDESSDCKFVGRVVGSMGVV